MPSWFPSATKSTPPPHGGLRAAWKTLSKREKRWLASWWAWVIVPSVIALAVFGTEQRGNYRATLQRHADRMDVTKNDAVSTPIDLTPVAGHENDVPVTVKAGVYLTRITELSIVHSQWNVDFFAWFVWDGADIKPGETFKIVHGEITARAPIRTATTGTTHYALYLVSAHITKEFDVKRFPRDEHLLTITLEDQGMQAYQLRYVADPQSEMSSRVFVPGYDVGKREVVAKLHTYKTAMGDPALPPSYKATYSDFVIAIPLTRSSWGLFFKMFTATFVAIGLALAGLFAQGASERIGLGSTALFVQVVNALTIAGLIPDTGAATLADVINGVAFFLIGLLLIQAILYHRHFADLEKHAMFALVFDRSTFILTLVLTVILNGGVLWAASPH